MINKLALIIALSITTQQAIASPINGDVAEFSTEEITKFIVSCAKGSKDYQFDALKCGCFMDAVRFKKFNAETKKLCITKMHEWLNNDDKNLLNIFAKDEWPSAVIAESQVNCFDALQKTNYTGNAITACACVGDGVRTTVTYAERLKMESVLGDEAAQKKFLDKISFLYEKCVEIK
jgi:hypothetical protein